MFLTQRLFLREIFLYVFFCIGLCQDTMDAGNMPGRYAQHSEPERFSELLVVMRCGAYTVATPQVLIITRWN
jgi:hypothetical protein